MIDKLLINRDELAISKPRDYFLGVFLWLFIVVNSSAQVVTDSFGKHRFDTPPVRVVVTDWALLEQMLELGITPVGAPELDLYSRYVGQPKLPKGIIDIGLRRSPSIAKIKSLDADVIVLGTNQKSLARPFSRISRVMYYKSFSDKYRTNGKKSRVRFLQIAELFQQTLLAKTKLADMDAELSVIKQQIHQYFNSQVPPVTLIRFSGNKKALVYGANSIAAYTLKQLDIRPAIDSNRSQWGETELTVSQLADIKEGFVLYINPVENPTVLTSQDWLSLPFVINKRVFPMAAVWSYGGAMSVLYHARAIRDALLKINL